MVHAGRLRKCSVLDHKSVILGHNVIRGERGQPIFERGASGGEIPLCTGANGTMTRRTFLQSLNEIYREGGLRTSQLVLAPGPVTQIVERVEMVRLALPTRMYTRNQLDYVARVVRNVARCAKDIRGPAHGLESIAFWWSSGLLRIGSAALPCEA